MKQRTAIAMCEHGQLPAIGIIDDCNYIAVFLTMACPYRCSYCINHFDSNRSTSTGRAAIMSGADWVAALSRLSNLDQPTGPVPVTLQGGEPSVHPDFYDIINDLPDRIRLDILTNLSFDVEEMIARVDPRRLVREAPYASIRVSYHPSQVQLDDLLAKTQRLLDAGFSVGVYGVLHPDQADHIGRAQARAQSMGIDFRTKDFLGYAQGKLHGRYKYPDACDLQTHRQVSCRTTELLVGPDGSVYNCHHHLYQQTDSVGHILDPDYRMMGKYHPCAGYGHCNPCDVKTKTNRFQQFGHTSVDIRFDQSAGTRQRALSASCK